MKDAVKITVIATGFREVSRPQHRQEVHHSFATTHDDAMEFPDAVGPSQNMSAFAESMTKMDEPTTEPVGMNRSEADVISLDTMRSAMVANFEQDDLDVPAFLRKRGEVM